MSKFKTSIPVDIKRVTDALPLSSYLEGVQFNRESSTVEVLWENDRLRTPFTFASEWPAEKLPEARETVAKALAAEESAEAPAPPPAAGPAPAVPTGAQEVVEKKRGRK